MKRIRVITMVAIGLVLSSILVFPAIAQSTTIAIEDVDVALDESKTVPIYIYNVTDPDGVGTVGFTLRYNSSVVHISGADASKSDFDFVFPEWNNSRGELLVGGSYFGIGPILTGDVFVMNVTFTAVGNVGDESPLTLLNTSLKDDTPQQNTIPHEVNGGMFRIMETTNTVYLDPSESSAGYGGTTRVEVRANASNFQGGQIMITYNTSCADITNWELNTAVFPIGEWDSSVAGQEWITFTDTGPLNGDYEVGTLTIQCVCDSDCSTPLDFVTPSALFVPSGGELVSNWIDGSFECREAVCGDGAPYPNGNDKVNMGDVIRLLNSVNNPGQYPVNGWAGNVNCDGELDMGDVVLLLNYVSYPGQYPLNCCVS